MYTQDMDNTIDAAHIRSIDTWNSGGGVELDIVELDGGTTLVVADETVAVYTSIDEFWAETETVTRATEPPRSCVTQGSHSPLNVSWPRKYSSAKGSCIQPIFVQRE